MGDSSIKLHVVKHYKHMGRRVLPDGSILPEIAARYATTRKIAKPLENRLFRKSAVAWSEKVNVAGSLLLSRQFNASGAWPELRLVERQRLHANVIGFLRSSVSEKFSDVDQLLTDAQMLHAYNFRAPYAFVRFARLRLSIRIFLKAPTALLVLLYAARDDPQDVAG